MLISYKSLLVGYDTPTHILNIIYVGSGDSSKRILMSRLKNQVLDFAPESQTESYWSRYDSALGTFFKMFQLLRSHTGTMGEKSLHKTKESNCKVKLRNRNAYLTTEIQCQCLAYAPWEDNKVCKDGGPIFWYSESHGSVDHRENGGSGPRKVVQAAPENLSLSLQNLFIVETEQKRDKDSLPLPVKGG